MLRLPWQVLLRVLGTIGFWTQFATSELIFVRLSGCRECNPQDMLDGRSSVLCCLG
jgi:hypothetical protein